MGLQVNPLLTVVVFAYNHVHYIKRTIDGILNQKTKYYFQIFVCDDCSTDDTYNILLEYDTKIKIFRNNHNLGLNKTFENIANRIDTKYFALIGGDDYWVDESKIEKQLNILESDNSISLVHTGFTYYNETTNSYKDIKLKWNYDYSNDLERRIVTLLTEKWSFYPLASTFCLRTNILKKGLKEYSCLLNQGVIGEGTIIHLSIALFGEKYYFIPSVTTVYTVRKQSLSHFKLVQDKILYLYKFALLKKKIAEILSLPIKKQNSIIYDALFRVLQSAYEYNQRMFFCEILRDSSFDIKIRSKVMRLCKSKLLFKLEFYFRVLKNKLLYKL